jgi:hypothetical protein
MRSERFLSLVGTYRFLAVLVAVPFLALGLFYLLHAAGLFFDPDRHGWWGRHRRLRWLATRQPMLLTYPPDRLSKARWVTGSVELLAGLLFVGVALAAMIAGG